MLLLQHLKLLLMPLLPLPKLHLLLHLPLPKLLLLNLPLKLPLHPLHITPLHLLHITPQKRLKTLLLLQPLPLLLQNNIFTVKKAGYGLYPAFLFFRRPLPFFASLIRYIIFRTHTNHPAARYAQSVRPFS